MTIATIKNKIMQSLSSLGVPVSYQVYGGSENSYFTYFIVTDENVAYGDGQPIASGFHIQLDSWSHGGMDEINELAKGLLQQWGFIYEFGRDLYESDTKMFHRIQQFYYTDEII